MSTNTSDQMHGVIDDEPFEDSQPGHVEPEPFDDIDEAMPTVVADEQALARQSIDLVSTAKALDIVDPATFEHAGQFLQALKDKQRQVEDFFREDIERAHASWKGLCNKRATYIEPLKEAIAIVSARYAAFAKEEQRKAEAERRRREEEALRVERERLEREAKEREEAALRADTREEAQQLEIDAEELRQEAATAQAPVLPLQSSITVPKGTQVKANWTFRVEDKLALIKAVAEGKVSHEALIPNDVYLRARAKADKDSVRIPGVQIYDAGTVAVRRNR